MFSVCGHEYELGGVMGVLAMLYVGSAGIFCTDDYQVLFVCVCSDVLLSFYHPNVVFKHSGFLARQ